MKNKFLYWTPRILSIIFILFLSLFALDVFEGNTGFWNIALALFMHLIPSFILLIILVISWRREIVGGISFIIVGIAHMIFSLMRVDVEPWYVSFVVSLIIDVPAFLIGILWILNWKKRKK